jgi:hypothetical protein
MCDKKTKPEFTTEQIADCKKCPHISLKKTWCCLFGCYIDGRPEGRRSVKRNAGTEDGRRKTEDGRIKLPSFIGGCCGKAKNIAVGWKRYLAGQSWPLSQKRLQICLACNEITHLTRIEYIAWLAKNNIKIIKNFNQLSRLDRLPKRPKAPDTEPYCQICKCHIQAKVLVETEACTIKKWGPVQALNHYGSGQTAGKIIQ